MAFGKKERKAQTEVHYFISIINQHSFYINNKFQRTMFKGTQRVKRKGNPTRRETQLELGACSKTRDEVEYKCYSRRPSDSSGKGTGRCGGRGGTQSSIN